MKSIKIKVIKVISNFDRNSESKSKNEVFMIRRQIKIILIYIFSQFLKHFENSFFHFKSVTDGSNKG